MFFDEDEPVTKKNYAMLEVYWNIVFTRLKPQEAEVVTIQNVYKKVDASFNVF